MFRCPNSSCLAGHLSAMTPLKKCMVAHVGGNHWIGDRDRELVVTYRKNGISNTIPTSTFSSSHESDSNLVSPMLSLIPFSTSPPSLRKANNINDFTYTVEAMVHSGLPTQNEFTITHYMAADIHGLPYNVPVNPWSRHSLSHDARRIADKICPQLDIMESDVEVSVQSLPPRNEDLVHNGRGYDAPSHPLPLIRHVSRPCVVWSHSFSPNIKSTVHTVCVSPSPSNPLVTTGSCACVTITSRFSLPTTSSSPSLFSRSLHQLLHVTIAPCPVSHCFVKRPMHDFTTFDLGLYGQALAQLTSNHSLLGDK